MYGYGFLNSFKSVGGTSVSYIVDDYSPAASYSLRKVSSTATNCIRVRRSSDNTEQDIGFVGNDLDTASLASFIGANSGYVTTLYDQSGNGKHQRQTTAGSQPIIVNAGSLVTILTKPTIQQTSSRFLYSSATVGEQLSINTSQRMDSFILMQHSANPLVIYAERSGSAQANIIAQSGSNSSSFTGSVTIDAHYKNGNAVTISTRSDAYTQISTDTPLLLSQINYVTTSQSFPSLTIGAYSGFELQGFLSECHIFTTDQSINRTAIESNINTYYGIY